MHTRMHTHADDAQEVQTPLTHCGPTTKSG